MIYGIGALCYGWLSIDDYLLHRRRSMVWGALMVQNIVVLVLLTLDIRTPGFWIEWRWLLTPVAVVVAVMGVLYLVERWQLRMALRRREGDDHAGSGI